MYRKPTHFILPALAIAILSLPACSTPNGDFPSLSKRPYESSEPISDSGSAVETITTILPSALASTTNRLLERNQIADAAFARARPAAESAARSGSDSGKGSENWVQAQMILSRLDAARADSVSALGEIDGLVAGERVKGADAGLVQLLADVQSRIAQSVANQEAVIKKLAATIGR
jgi:hypothetical protein